VFDRELVHSILLQIDEAIARIRSRTSHVVTADYFTNSPEGMEKLDAVAMLFIAIGESVKNIDKATGGLLLAKYPQIDWTGVKGFRDIIAHHYFDIDAEQVFWILTHELDPLSKAIKEMIQEVKQTFPLG
jgi:uncharacterized protein with HEPN domain